MKFSYNLIKKLAPGKYDKKFLVEKLNLHSFETADLSGDILEISVAPNRYSDAASHIGIAREIAAILKIGLKDPLLTRFKPDVKERGVFTANIKEKLLCSRYIATYVTNIEVGATPDWMKKVLEVCGLRSLNNIVDIMNYVMLETGQPLHAFDADKVSGGLVVREAKKGEKIETIDGENYTLDPSMLVIADSKQALAIAGIKGGKYSEVTHKTKRLLVESATFNGVNVYKTSRRLGLTTDASIRFSHQLSPELANLSMARALGFLKELANGKVYGPVDVYSRKQPRRLLKVDVDKINKLIGHEFSLKEIWQKLISLGFSAFTEGRSFSGGKGGSASGEKKIGLKAEIPLLRLDINNIEDIAEEVARLYGYNNLTVHPPTVELIPVTREDQITLKARVRSLLVGAGFSEVYNYSFLSKKEVSDLAVQLFNPISRESEFLRDSITPHLIKNLKSNIKYFSDVRIFEIGKIFSYVDEGGVQERLMLGMGITAQDSHRELRGVIDSLFGNLGITDYRIAGGESGNNMVIEVDSEKIGNLNLVPDIQNTSVAELDLEKLLSITSEEREFKPLSKFPSIIRDVSLYISSEVRVGDVLIFIQQVGSKLVHDVDLVDFYEPPVEARDRSIPAERRRKSLTFRIVFQSDERTLTDDEVNREVAIIQQLLTEKFDAELR